jgi:hypothetical protein
MTSVEETGEGRRSTGERLDSESSCITKESSAFREQGLMDSFRQDRFSVMKIGEHGRLDS